MPSNKPSVSHPNAAVHNANMAAKANTNNCCKCGTKAARSNAAASAKATPKLILVLEHLNH